MKKYIHSKAFTLVELLVVISVISMLSSVVIVNVQSARAKSRDALREQQLRQIDNATQMYIQDKGHAPFLKDSDDSPLCQAQSNYSAATVNASACFAVSTAGTETPQGQAWLRFKEELKEYMPNIPDDPCPTCGGYGYTYASPLALQAACHAAGTCAHDAEYFNQTYGLYVPLETVDTVSGNTDSSSANDMSSNFGTGRDSNSNSTNELTVVISGSPTEQVSVTINGSDECSDTDCTFEYDDGEDITAVVSYTNSDTFLGWTDSLCDSNGTESECRFELNSDRTIAVYFGEQNNSNLPNNIPVTVSVNGLGEIRGSGYSCGVQYGLNCTVNFNIGDTVVINTVRAIKKDIVFTGWTNSTCGTYPECTFVVDSPNGPVANWELREPLPIINIDYPNSDIPGVKTLNWSIQNAVFCSGYDGGEGGGYWIDSNMSLPTGTGQVWPGRLNRITCRNSQNQEVVSSTYAPYP